MSFCWFALMFSSRSSSYGESSSFLRFCPLFFCVRQPEPGAESRAAVDRQYLGADLLVDGGQRRRQVLIPQREEVGDARVRVAVQVVQRRHGGAFAARSSARAGPPP